MESKDLFKNNKKQFAFAAIDKQTTVTVPSPTEGEARGKNYITWGDDNAYPDYLYNLYLDTDTLKTIIDGTAEAPVVIQGDRLEAYYKDTPGQWEQIMLMDGRAGHDHRISHAIIRNGFIGINCQSVLKATQCALRLDNTIIENQSGYGLYSILYAVEAKNFVVANCGYGNFWAFGGDYRFVHGTFSNYWNANEQDNNKNAVTVMNYVIDGNTEETFYYPFNMEMGNCIIYGKQKDELKTTFGPEADSSYLFDHCLIRSAQYENYRDGYSHCLFNKDPFFANPMKADCHIDSIASPVIGMGNPLYGNELPNDLDGVSRIGAPDMGAYQFVNFR